MTTEPLDTEQTLRQIGEGRAHIDKVKAIIARLEASQDDTTVQRDLLKSLEEAQHQYLAHLDSLDKRTAT